MNLILLFDDDFISAGRVRLTGRRLRHVTDVHRAKPGDDLTVGLAGGRIGRGRITNLGHDALDMDVILDCDPPPPIAVTLILAVPRPKVLNRVIASTTSMGVKQMYLVNAWRVEKSYWDSPRLDATNLRTQAVLGLEQARDTILPDIHLRRFFRPFVEEELPRLIAGTRALVADPHAADPVPCATAEAVTLAIGPEGGFIAEEIASLAAIGFAPVHLGSRILRVETAVAALLARLSV